MSGKKRVEDRDQSESNKKGGQKEVQTLSNSYLMVDPNKLNGVLPKLYNFTDYNGFSRPTDDIDIATGAPAPTVTSLPDPIVGKHIQLPDGDTTTAALSWAATGEQNSGLIRAATDDYQYLVNGSSVTEWLAAEFRVNYLTATRLVFVGANGKLTDDAALTYNATTDTLSVAGTIAASSLSLTGFSASRIPYFADGGSVLTTDDGLTYDDDTELLSIGGDIRFKSGTSFYVTFEHTASSNITVTFQNAAGTVYITGGQDVTVSDGGTGASTAAGARANLDVPSNSEAILDAIMDAKGDLIVATAADTPARLAVGSNGTVLMAASGEATGVAWDNIMKKISLRA